MAGYDLYSIETKQIPHHFVVKVDTGITIQKPEKIYARIICCSDFAVKHQITTQGGFIDPDYIGLIELILYDFDDKDFHITKGYRVAQLILEKYTSAPTSVPNSAESNTKVSNAQRIK